MFVSLIVGVMFLERARAAKPTHTANEAVPEKEAVAKRVRTVELVPFVRLGHTLPLLLQLVEVHVELPLQPGPRDSPMLCLGLIFLIVFLYVRT